MASINPVRRWHYPYFWPIQRWNGGLSEDSRIGLQGAFRAGQGLDIRSDTGLLSIANKVVNDSGTNVNKLISWIVPALSQGNGDGYYYGQDTIYKRAGSNGAWSVAHSLTTDSPNGQGMAEFNGRLYYRTATKLGQYDYTTWNDSFQTGLTSSSKWGPLCAFKNYLLVGHGNYVATLDQVGVWTLQRLTLPPGYNVRHIFSAGSVAIILAGRGSSITDATDGIAFTWRGASPNYDDYIPLHGNPHAGIAYNNRIYVITGMDPILETTQGGQSIIEQGIPATGLGKTAEVYPGAITTWRNLIHFGLSDGTSSTVWRGVYNFGAKNAKFPNALNPEFPITTTNSSGTTVQITAVQQFGNSLHIAWKDTTTGVTQQYGVDTIDITKYQTTATYKSLYYDHEDPFTKRPKRLILELSKPLNTGESVTAKLSGNPYSDPEFTDTTSLMTASITAVGDTFVDIPVESMTTGFIASRDLQFELTLTGPGTSTPFVKRVMTFIEPEVDIIGAI